MELLIIITIIAAIVIYCLLKPSNKTPTPSIEEPTKPTPPTKPTTPPNNKKKLVGPFSRTWTLTEFSREFGPMQYSNNQINSDTKEVFTSCRFIKNDNITYVNFHKSLGVLTKDEIMQKKDDLMVGLNMNGKYVFYIGNAGSLDDVNLRL
jgi:hypothetical protein